MIAIKPFAEIIDFGDTDALKKIELVGRTCYKSTNKITDESAPKFVTNLIKRGHEAMIEHASFIFEIDYRTYCVMRDIVQGLISEGFISYIRFTTKRRYLMSGNVRAWRNLFKAIEQDYMIPSFFKDFIHQNPILFPEFQNTVFGEYVMCGIYPVSVRELKTRDEFLTHCDVTVRFVVDRGISHEIVRHRVASFAQESTRYCNYSKDDFGTQITYIIPSYLTPECAGWNVWRTAMVECEEAYFDLLNIGLTAQEARAVLPNSLKTEVIMTANCAEWKHFFKLRACNSTGKAHPQMLEVTIPLLNDFKNTINVIFDDLVGDA